MQQIIPVLQARSLRPKFFRQTSLQEEMQAQKILHFYPNLFISLTYIPVLASGSNEAKQEEENVSAAKKLKLDTTGQPGTSGVSSTSKTRKIKGKDKRKITFSVDKISLQT